MKLIRRLESHLRSKKKRPLERGLGHGSDTVFQYYNSNDFRYLVEGDPGIEDIFFRVNHEVLQHIGHGRIRFYKPACSSISLSLSVFAYFAYLWVISDLV
jgi:hypothetical protein